MPWWNIVVPIIIVILLLICCYRVTRQINDLSVRINDLSVRINDLSVRTDHLWAWATEKAKWEKELYDALVAEIAAIRNLIGGPGAPTWPPGGPPPFP